MDIYEIILTGVALAMDASALTIANCTTYKGKLTPLKEWSMPVAFTLFQMLMPIIGFYIGSLIAQYISSVAGYITAGIFLLLSVKIIFDNVMEIVKAKKQSTNDNIDEQSKTQKKVAEFTIIVLLIQAVATSIDALAIGVTLSLTEPAPFIPALIIGGVTLVISSLALIFGKYLGKLFGKYASWVGATILMALAVKSLVEAIIG